MLTLSYIRRIMRQARSYSEPLFLPGMLNIAVQNPCAEIPLNEIYEVILVTETESKTNWRKEGF